MRATVRYGAGDMRVEHRPDPAIKEPGDAVVRVRPVIDTSLGLDQVAAGYQAMAGRPALKVLVRP